MASVRVAINGFGRIGRNAFKIAFDHPDLQVVAINDLTDTKTLAYLLRHDSNYGTYHHKVGFDDQNIIVDDKPVRVLAEKDPAKLPWKDLNVDVVIESTGFFTKPEDAKAHLTAGARRVVISAPAKGEGAGTFVIGVNADKITVNDTIVSNASCTTNCITPVAAVIEAAFGIDKAMMTTVHSYTASQVLQDGPAKDLREGRNAAENIVPTTTGATIAAAQALPALKGVFQGLSIRVPTPVVSLSDFTFVTKKPATIEEINLALTKAASNLLYKGILAVTDEELVSSDFIGDSHSAIVDLNLTNVVGGTLVKVVAWYDNEWGYSNRLVEMVETVAKTLSQSAPTTVAVPVQPVVAAAATVPPAAPPAPTPVPAPTPTPAPVAPPVQPVAPTPSPAPVPTPVAVPAPNPLASVLPPVQTPPPPATQAAPTSINSAPDLPLIPTELTPNPEVLVNANGQVTTAPVQPATGQGVQQ